MVYQVNCKWVGREYSVSPNIVYDVLHGIEETKGNVSREDFLDASRPEESPTHKLFQWDDARAAELYRLNQAGNIMNALKVEVITQKDGKPRSAPAFVRVEKSTDGGKYNNLSLALSVESKRQFVLNQAYEEMRSFKRKYETLSELASVIDAINITLEQE